MQTLEERKREITQTEEFKSKVWSKISENQNGCWVWGGRTNNSGYPMITVEETVNGKRNVYSVTIQKYMLETHYGKEIDTKFIQVNCGNKICCNPAHLVEKTLEARMMKYEVVGNNCWKWLGNVGPNGYGYMTIDRQSVTAHRASYKFHKGEIPPGLMVLHSRECVTRLCINPDHLRLGTHDDNMNDMEAMGSLKGEKNPNNILTADQVSEIKEKIKSRQITYRNIAAEYGVSRQAIKDIALGRTWKWLEAE